MSLNESHVEEAALSWFGELGYALGNGPDIAPCEPAAERDFFGEVVLVGRLREAIRRLKLDYAVGHGTHLQKFRIPAIRRDTLLPKLQSEELSVTKVEERFS